MSALQVGLDWIPCLRSWNTQISYLLNFTTVIPLSAGHLPCVTFNTLRCYDSGLPGIGGGIFRASCRVPYFFPSNRVWHLVQAGVGNSEYYSILNTDYCWLAMFGATLEHHNILWIKLKELISRLVSKRYLFGSIYFSVLILEIKERSCYHVE